MKLRNKDLNVFHLFLISLCTIVSCGKVIEMDDRLIELKAQGKWLVTFYAPWCGHCRKLEPVMDEVAKQLNDKALAIAKIDATRFTKSANHFEIKAYPTIKFINGEKVIDYHGERRKNDIIEFISKADSPRVTRILNQVDFQHKITKHKHFFLLVSTSKDEAATLTKVFYELANIFFLDAYFFHASPDQVSKALEVTETPSVYAMKEGLYFKLDNEKQALVEFVKNERYLTFMEITISNFHNLIETQKTLVILNLNTIEKSKEKHTTKLKQVYEQFSKAARNINHNDFQFGYVDNSDLLNGIAIWTLQTPLLFIFNTTSYTYSLFDLVDVETKKNLLDLDIQHLLDEVKLGNVEFMGGHSYFRTLRRPLWELYRAVLEMFFEAPFLSMLIFGFPFGVISIVFYFLCCIESNDQSDEEFENSDTEDELNEDEDYYMEDEIANAELTSSAEDKKTQ